MGIYKDYRILCEFERLTAAKRAQVRCQNSHRDKCIEGSSVSSLEIDSDQNRTLLQCVWFGWVGIEFVMRLGLGRRRLEYCVAGDSWAAYT